MKTGNLKIPPDVIDRIKQLPFTNIKHLDEEKYKNLGYDIDILNRHEQYGTGDALKDGLKWQWTDIFSPAGWREVGLQFDRSYPGYCMPPHKDHYNVYLDKFPWITKEQVRRRLVFLEDWQPGHYFQVNNDVFIRWRQGDWVEFGPEDIHFGGNLGPDVRYTLQITGVEQ
jgi:hypothetical protein